MTKEQFISANLFQFIGCNCYEECPKTKSEDDLYLVSLEYFGRYEDDDCNFVYMNAKDGSIHTDTWTTRCAAPHFNTFLRMTVQDAVEAGYMPKEHLDNYINCMWENFKAYVARSITLFKNEMSEKVAKHGKTLNIPCVVGNRCRKYKGEGYLIRIVKRRDQYLHYGDHYNYFAKVLGTDGKIYTVGAASVGIDMVAIRKRLFSMLPTLTDTNQLYDIFPIVDLGEELTHAVDVEFASKVEKWQSYKAVKFPGLLEWCKKTKPEMDNMELHDWAEKIYRKNNPFPVMD